MKKIVHLIAPKDYTQVKKAIENIVTYKGQDIKLQVTEWDYSFNSFDTWSKNNKCKSPDIVLMFDTADYSKIDIETGEKIGYKNLLENIKNARFNLDSKFILILSEEKEKQLTLINELIKININNFYFISEFNEDDLANWLLGIDKTIENNQQYIEIYNSNNGQIKIIEKEIEKEVEKIVEVEKVVEIEKEIIKTIKQQVITFFTTDDNISKSDVLTQITTLISKNTKQKILVCDFDTMYSNLDHFFEIEKELDLVDVYNNANVRDTSLTALYNSIERNILDVKVFKQLIKKHKKYKNLDLITGLRGFDYFDKIDIKHFVKIIEFAKELYDLIIINTNPSIVNKGTMVSLKKSTKIIVVTGANYTYARNTLEVLKELTEYQSIPKEKFYIVVNNMSSSSLNNTYMEAMFKDYKNHILGYIPFNMQREECLNKGKIFIDTLKDKQKKPYIDIINKLGYSKEKKHKFFPLKL